MMVYLFGALISFLIVCGQVLWKTGVGHLNFELTKNTILSSKSLELLFSPYFILGVLSYLVATLLFMVMLGRFQYTYLQAVVVSSSLFFTLIASVVLFGERPSVANLFGFLLLFVGVIFVTRF